MSKKYALTLAIATCNYGRMSDVASESIAPAAEAPDPAVLSHELTLRQLEEMAEIGMARLRALPSVAADAASDGKTRDVVDPFDRLSRAIRLTLVLKGRIHAELRDLKAGVVKARAEAHAEAEKRARERTEKASDDRIERVRELVLNVAESEHEKIEDFDRVYEALGIRLEMDEPIFGSAEHPLRAVVDHLCKELDLHPDWSRWEGEGWLADNPLSSKKCVSLKDFVRAREANPPEPEMSEAAALSPKGHVLE
jgi:hypothetical protein